MRNGPRVANRKETHLRVKLLGGEGRGGSALPVCFGGARKL